MKLWKKTVLLMLTTLLFSLAFVGGLTLYITGKNNLKNAAETSARQMIASGKMLESFWDGSKYERLTDVGKNSYRIFQFENCFGSGYAMFEDGEMIANRTGYKVVDIQALEIDRSAEKTDYRIQKLSGKYLLLQQLHLEQTGFLILSVRDITEGFKELGELAVWYLGIYMIIFLIAGTFIYLMMRRTILTMECLQETAEKQELLLGALAHEMKTPLTSVIGYSDSLLHVRLSEGQRYRALENINREGRRMETLSGKMLQMLGLYQNQSIEMKERRIEEVIDCVIGLKRDKAVQCGISIRTEGDGFSLQMDAELMESLLINLVDNALRASGPGSTVVVRAEYLDHRKVLQVEDQGIGIPQSELPRVTEAFYMVDKSRSRRAGGSGLGLALCVEIARLHHGKLSIESREGQGTTVSVTFS